LSDAVAMLRTVFTLVLVVSALSLAVTPRGLALFGSNRRLVVAVLTLIALLQAYRLFSARQAKRRDELVKKIPKRPLGI